jgi:hypothetical protein
VKPDVLRFYGREALSEPFRWDSSTPGEHLPEEVLMKYATFRMRSGKVHGMVTRLEWLSTSKDQSHYRLTLSSRLALLGYTRQCAVYQNQSVPEVVEQLRKHGLEDLILNSDWSAPTRRVKLSPSGGKRTLSLSGAFCPRWAFTGARRWTTCAVWIRTFLPTASFTTGLTCLALQRAIRPV